MTAPTEAQIEAAANALWPKYGYILPKEALIATLTAAAEADDTAKETFDRAKEAEAENMMLRLKLAAAEAGYSEPQGTGFQAGEPEPAAVEVGESTDKCARCGYPKSEHHHEGACYGLCGEFVTRTAAAEAGEQYKLETKRLSEIERLYKCIEAYRSELNRTREDKATTIARCAQVAKEHLKLLFPDQDVDTEAESIAAAIRALKDEP